MYLLNGDLAARKQEQQESKNRALKNEPQIRKVSLSELPLAKPNKKAAGHKH